MQITIVEHPLIKHKLSKMRDINSTSRDFREWLDETISLLCPSCAPASAF